MTVRKISPVLLEAAKILALESFEVEDYQGLKETLAGMRDGVEPYRYQEINTMGYFGLNSLKREEPRLREYCDYLDQCLADIDSFDPQVFEQIVSDVITTIRENSRLAKQLR